MIDMFKEFIKLILKISPSVLEKMIMEVANIGVKKTKFIMYAKSKFSFTNFPYE